jgi:cysteinyl-tRNA synthetase
LNFSEKLESSLRLFNTLTRTREPFRPIEDGKVRMYVCGMTVYDYCHIGHARVFVVFDALQRWLRASGFQVTYVRNITDIDDKIIKRAAESGQTIGELTARFIRYMDEDAAALGAQPPDHEPRATQYLPQMISMIGTLEEKGFAYRAPGGDVNYSVRKFPGYGQLSGKSLDDLRAGERVEVDAQKQDPLDFVLWKRAKPGEPAWPSPFGEGRPGWHIECSAMSTELLGPHFDIHGGGADLQFPHHENEIAQSEGACGVKFVNYWVHNGFVRVDDEKMSKSLGNFFTIREVLQKFDAEVVRFFILHAHYRSPLNYSDQHLEESRQALSRLYTALKGSAAAVGTIDWTEKHAAAFKAAMDDDLNTPEAIAVLFELAGDANRGDAAAAARLRHLGAVLGLLQRDPTEFLQGGPGAAALAEPDIERLIAERAAAKKARDYTRADGIRQQLKDAGIVLEDGPRGTTWRRM